MSAPAEVRAEQEPVSVPFGPAPDREAAPVSSVAANPFGALDSGEDDESSFFAELGSAGQPLTPPQNNALLQYWIAAPPTALCGPTGLGAEVRPGNCQVVTCPILCRFQGVARRCSLPSPGHLRPPHGSSPAKEAMRSTSWALLLLRNQPAKCRAPARTLRRSGPPSQQQLRSCRRLIRQENSSSSSSSRRLGARRSGRRSRCCSEGLCAHKQ